MDVCVDVDVYGCICISFQNARREASSGLLSFRARTPTEDAPPFSGDFAPVLARMGPRPIKARPFEPKACLRGDEEAGARSGPVENPRVHSQPEGGSVPPTAYVRTVMAVFAILWLHVGAWYPKRGRTGQKTV